MKIELKHSPQELLVKAHGLYGRHIIPKATISAGPRCAREIKSETIRKLEFIDSFWGVENIQFLCD